MKFGFCGPAYQGQAASANAQALINWYLETSEAPNAKSQFQLLPTPGSKVFATLANIGVRGVFTTNPQTSAERAFAVAGNTLYELSSAGVGTSRGTVVNDSKPVSWAFNGTQILVASGGVPNVFTLGTNAFTTPALPFSEAVPQVRYVDGYGIALRAGTKSFNISGINDFTSWNGSDFGTVSVFPDNLISMGGDHRQIIFHGLKKTIVYYNDGTATFPFSPVPGSGLIEQGAGSVFGNATLDSTEYWWGQDENGAAMAWRLAGYSPQRISTEHIEYVVNLYPQWTDVECFSMQYQGHTWFVSRFPSANGGLGETWVYDVKMGSWFKWSFFQNGQHQSHRSRCHAFAFGKHLVGDPNSGNIYQLDVAQASGTAWSFADDAGSAIKRVRRSPYSGSGQAKWDYFPRLEVQADMGLGPIPPLTDGAGNARGPQLMLRWSNDNAQTWSNEYSRSFGQRGNYGTRVFWQRLGRAWGLLGRVWELSCSDPVPVRITDADVQVA